jgi:orotate phosphoribosyltransferase
VLLIDDLATTGGSIIETATELQMASLIVRDAIVLVNRDEGARERLHYHNYNLIPILSLDTILNYLMATGRISEDWYKRSIDYIERRRAAISFPLLSQDKPEAESE